VESPARGAAEVGRSIEGKTGLIR